MEKETEIKKENKKEKKKTFKVLNIISILTLLSSIFLIINIYTISGIENTLRYIAMTLILLFNILLVTIFRKKAKKGKKKLIAYLLITLILTAIQIFLGYFINRTYNSLDNMNKDKITYTSVLVTKKDSKIENIDSLKDKKIGIVIDETSIDGYIIGLEIINDEKLEENNKIIEYTDFSTLVKDLYKKEIDVMIIGKNYPSMFKSIKEYQNIETDTKIIYEKSKTLTKEEIAKYTGDEMLNFNTSDKIDKPFTVLVMGIDSNITSLDKNATGNGDALMLITFNPKTLNATILSIPRDTYVPIACFAGEKENKITHAAWNGESCMIKTIENFTKIDIDYYVKINFQGVIKLVNALGGIEVDVPLEFCESNSYRSTKKENLICLKKGIHTLNGEQALALARHRKTLLTGDLQRGMNQQLVVQGIINKLKSIKSANQMLKILDTISISMDTNFTTKQILSFYEIAKNLLLTSSNGNLINMQQLYLQGASQMIYDEGIGMVLYNYIYNEESLKQIVSIMKQNLELEEVKPVKKMSFNISEVYKTKTIGNDITTATKTYSLLPNFIGENESYATGWLSRNGISYKITTKDVSSGYRQGQIIDQSYPEGKRLDLIDGAVIITIANVTSSAKEENNPSEKPETTIPEENTTTPEEEQTKEPEEPTTPEETLPEEVLPEETSQ